MLLQGLTVCITQKNGLFTGGFSKVYQHMHTALEIYTTNLQPY